MSMLGIKGSPSSTRLMHNRAGKNSHVSWSWERKNWPQEAGCVSIFWRPSNGIASKFFHIWEIIARTLKYDGLGATLPQIFKHISLLFSNKRKTIWYSDIDDRVWSIKRSLILSTCRCMDLPARSWGRSSKKTAHFRSQGTQPWNRYGPHPKLVGEQDKSRVSADNCAAFWRRDRWLCEDWTTAV